MKYSPDQLAEMAQQALAARSENDPRFKLLLLSMYSKTGLSLEEVGRKIEGLANGSQ